MQAIEDKILNKMKKCGRGKLYSASDFAVYGSAVSVAKALERLTRKGGLVRIARGLYCYPKIDRKFGLGIQYPTINEIAEKVARQSEARVVPTGMHALNVLGLSAQVPMNYVFYTTAIPGRSICSTVANCDSSVWRLKIWPIRIKR